MGYVILILLRFYISSQDEIIPLPVDSANYAEGITHDIWFEFQRSGVSVLAWLTREFGFPYKLVLDSAYVALCVAASRRIAGCTRSELLALVVFFLLAFQSYFLRASMNFMSDPAVACLMLAAVLLFGRILERPVARWNFQEAILVGIAVSFWAMTRPEDMIIISAFAVIAVVQFFMQRYYWREGWSARALILLLPLIMMVASDGLIRLQNFRTHHLAVQSRMYGPGTTALLNALYSIPPDQEVRYCPVRLSTFEAAARVSPTIRTLLPELTDTSNAFWVYGSQVYERSNEVGSYLNFLLPDVYGKHYSIEDGEADKMMMRSAEEIRAAQARGQLGRRAELYPIDPLWRLWVPELPRQFAWGIWSSFGLHFEVRTLEEEAASRTDVRPLSLERNFSDGLLLRTALNAGNDLDIFGSLAKTRRESVATSVLLRAGDDVLGASRIYPFTPTDDSVRFAMSIHPAPVASAASLEFWSGLKLIKSVPIELVGSHPCTVDVVGESWWIRSDNIPLRISSAKRLEEALFRLNDAFLLFGAAICAVLSYFATRRSRDFQFLPLAAVVAAAVAFMLPRIAFYTILSESWAKRGGQRFFSANSPTAFLTLLVVCCLLGHFAGKWKRTRLTG